MSDVPDVRRWSPRAFLSHLNQRHPDTVLFLARHLAGDPGMQVAELVDVHADQLVLRTGTPGQLVTASVPLGSVVGSRADLVAELRRLLLIARAAAPDEPVTSLEADIATRHPTTGAVDRGADCAAPRVR